MEFLGNWWNGLDPLTRWFFGVAFFFSFIFLWQLVMSFIGLHGGDGAVDSQVEATDVHHSPGDADASVDAFKLFSFRSVLAFLTLFSWAGALELQSRHSMARALGFAFLWGAIAMLLMAWLLHTMKRLAETGNLRYSSCVGCEGTVYLDIPPGGIGEVRTLVSGTMTHVKARGATAEGIKAGVAVRIVRMLGQDTVEVTKTVASA